ncbi:MAG: ATP-binding protein [Saprospiraceae bacterium]
MAEKRYPFKFLDAYAREDSDIFFGRNDEIENLYEMVFQSDLLLVYGASGTGKTSLIQCGLANKFQTHDWLPLFIRRGSNLNQAFANELETAGGTLAEADNNALDWLDDDLSNETSASAATKTLSPLARRLRAIYLRHFKPVYLIFDQFEELYVLGDKKEQDKFIESVQEILRVEQPVKIIISIREEYLGYLYDFERAVPELLRKKLRVEPMNLDKVQTVITSVGQLPNSNVRLETGQEAAIANQIFEKIRGGATSLTIELPYLQVFLDKLYLHATGDEHRQADALLSLDTLKKIGNIGDVLRDFLDEQVLLIARALDQKPDAIWRILSPLVTLDGTKEPLSGPDLCNRRPEMAPALIDSTLQALVKGRILRFTEHNQRYEIAHDSLAKQIAAKRSDEEISLLEVQRMIKSQVAMKAEAREYFSEKQLAFMEPYLQKLTLGNEENTHIENSRKFLRQKKKKQQQRKKVTYASIAAAFVLLAALAIWALGQKKTAEESLEKVERTEIVKKAEELKTYGDSYRDLQKDSSALDTYQQAWDTLDFYQYKHPELKDEEIYQALKKILNK